MRLRIARIFLGSGLLLSAIGFTFCHMLANPRPPYSSMGNVAIFFVGMLVPITGVIVYGWVRLLGSALFHKWSKWFLVLLPIHIVAAILWQVYSLDSYREMLGNHLEAYYGSRDDQYILDITQGFDNQMNSQFFNLNTWLAYVSMTLWVALMISFVMKLRKVT
ncbi:hypothetical protein [Alkalicoccobacillus gibsonii]|uniref:hypothetical protein n=1 Tax=Alkalicoccobacillus gibsonii TaxID=79881 RepID=UPI00193212CC|nr:hypothetical protein [Alkalicoccobacillus gibsonii]MBM0064069.1 hypothetical protein [Alkalicoccobacillus gibsonii]